MKKTSELLKLSASAIKTYEGCHRKYYYSYVDVQPKKKWPHLELGNFVHAVLEQFHEEAPKTEHKDLPRLMARICNEVRVKFELSNAQVGTSQKMLIDYLILIDENGLPPVIANEQGFSIKLDEDNILIRGYIDRIDQDAEGNYTIVDYKTGKSKYLDEFQLMVYGMYLLNAHPDLERFKGSYIVLSEKSKPISYIFTKTDINRCVDKIRKIADDIRSDQTWEPNPTRLCSFCDFEDICPAMTAKHQGWNIKNKTYLFGV